MRRTASEVVRNLEMRIARLERQASGTVEYDEYGRTVEYDIDYSYRPDVKDSRKYVEKILKEVSLEFLDTHEEPFSKDLAEFEWEYRGMESVKDQLYLVYSIYAFGSEKSESTYRSGFPRDTEAHHVGLIVPIDWGTGDVDAEWEDIENFLKKSVLRDKTAFSYKKLDEVVRRSKKYYR